MDDEIDLIDLPDDLREKKIIIATLDVLQKKKLFNYRIVETNGCERVLFTTIFDNDIDFLMSAFDEECDKQYVIDSLDKLQEIGILRYKANDDGVIVEHLINAELIDIDNMQDMLRSKIH